MTEYAFVLKYRLPHGLDSASVVEALGAADCTDALVGTGLAGRLALEFDREAEDSASAITSAIDDVARALPQAELIEVGPDLVGLTEIAELLDVSRQNMRKLIVGASGSPLPVHDGSTTLWHLADVLDWLVAAKGYRIERELRDTARAARSINLDRLVSRHGRAVAIA
ncbi:DNA-binding protein [Rhizobium sp. AG855]|uniref:helix-turn-helix transcriptional regulator n=1 Tax=Rhizobium sp. AG855 TaxID=2183898 RepID=UPI000E76819A|nr:DNA-binding protein [Rhizobium sp. AG855]